VGFLVVSRLIARSPSKKATPVGLIALSSPEFPILVIAKISPKVQHNNFCQRPFLTTAPFFLTKPAFLPSQKQKSKKAFFLTT